MFELLGSILWSEAQSRTIKLAEDKLRDRKRRSELAKICADQLRISLNDFRILEDDLSGDLFLKSILAPHLITIINRPSKGLRPRRLSNNFFKTFIDPLRKHEEREVYLKERYKTDSFSIRQFFRSLLDRICEALEGSEHWKHEGVRLFSRDLGQRILKIESTHSLDSSNDFLRLDDTDAMSLYIKLSQAKLKGDFATVAKMITPLFDRLGKHGSNATEDIQVLGVEALCISFSAIGHLQHPGLSAAKLLGSIALPYTDKVRIRDTDLPRLFVELASMNQGIQNYRTCEEIMDLIGTPRTSDALSIKLAPRALLQRIALGDAIDDSEVVSILRDVGDDGKSAARMYLVRAWNALAAGDRNDAKALAAEGAKAAALNSDQVLESELLLFVEILSNQNLTAQLNLRAHSSISVRPSFWDFSSGFDAHKKSLKDFSNDQHPLVGELSAIFAAKLI